MPVSVSKSQRRKAATPSRATALQRAPTDNGKMNETVTLQEVQAQLNAFRALQQIAHSLSSELNLELLIRKILRAAQEVMQASNASIFLHDPATDELVFTFAEGGGNQLEGMRMPSNKGIAGWVFIHQEPLIVDDTSQDKRFYSQFDKTTGFKTDSIIGVPLITKGKSIGVLEVLNKHSGEKFNQHDLDILMALAAQSAIAIENARLIESLREERNRILAVEEEVRKELARDLHDGLAQLLISMVMNVRFVQDLHARHEATMLVEELKNLESLATRANRQVRDVLFDQRPVILETQGLFPTLEAYVKRLKETGEVNAELEVKCQPISLPGKADRTIFSIVQEAMGNAKKYAKGALVKISVEQSKNQLIFKVADGGPGFDVHKVQANYATRGSLGLLNMHERAQQVGGEWRIDSTVGQGTTVTLTVPIPAEAKAVVAKA